MHSSEQEAEEKGTQYLKLEMRMTPILVHHIIPNNFAVQCFAQLPLHKKLQPNFQIAAWLPKGGAFASLLYIYIIIQ